MKTFLKRAQQLGELRLFDIQFAEHLLEVNGAQVPELLLAATLASNRISHGDTCLKLDTVKSCSLYTSPELRAVRQKLPVVEKWREVLLAQKIVCAAPLEPPLVQLTEPESEDLPFEAESSADGTSDKAQTRPHCPLILDQSNRLYLARYWTLEQSLIKSIQLLLDQAPPEVDSEKLSAALGRLFGAADVSGDADMQKASVANAVLNNFCVITGGPGTGKTYTVTALLAALMDQGVEPRKIALAAPTGKAATRLTQSIQRDLTALMKALGLPDAAFESVTLHKLLGAKPGRVVPRHHAQAPLPYDVVIIDEASMIDLPMMARTFDALAADTRIVLIGDKDQLHSVESGMVLGDICGGRTQTELSKIRCNELASVGVNNISACASASTGGGIADRIIYLEKSHRVKDDGGINKLASAVNSGQVETALQLLAAQAQSSVSLLPQESTQLEAVLREHVVPVAKNYTTAETPQAALGFMSDTGVLCALRHGPTGSVRINALVEKLLIDDDVIAPAGNYYHGQPLMITENSNHQRLYNGDHGLVLTDKNNQLSVFFSSDARADKTDVVRSIGHNRLPQHETFYAMTVHKSQGSEYSTVVVVLPDTDSPILSRELLYTAITRARSKVIILANEDQLRACIERCSVRQSGLRDMFWTDASAEKTDTTSSQADLKDSVASGKNSKTVKKKSSKPVQQSLDF